MMEIVEEKVVFYDYIKELHKPKKLYVAVSNLNQKIFFKKLACIRDHYQK